MTGIRNSNPTASPSTARRKPLPFLGVTSLIAGAIMPAWAILAAITGGPDAAWVPVVLFFGFPYNIVSLALFVVAVICGIYALRNAGADRVLGRIGLILAGIQLLVAVPLAWAFTSALFAG